MKLVIFGATGIAGQAVLQEALSKGHSVRILTRNRKKVRITHPNLSIVEGNVTNPNVVLDVLKGADAVIQTLGIGGKGDGKTTTFVSEANKIIMAQMKTANVNRLIAISVIGAGDSWTFLPAIYRNVMMPLFVRWFKPIIDDKNRMESDIMNSDLDWTIVRSTTIKNGIKTVKMKVSLDGKGLKFYINTGNLAQFIVNQLTDNTFIHQTPTISN